MKERPILFSGPMVRAILEGQKTQTRRIIKPQPVAENNGMEWKGWDFISPEMMGHNCHPTHGQPGDRLWVKETWKVMLHSPGYDNGLQESGGEDYESGVATIAYRAGGDMVTVDFLEEREDEQASRGMMRWKPSIHMPRWASRITLEIVSVRVERLQEITRGDCMAEGCPFPNIARETSPKQWFADLWQSINTKEGKTWNDNPWVWVIEFKRVAA